MCKVLLLILALFAPPLAVLLDRGCHRSFWMNCLLTLLFFIPGVIHAFMVILSDKHRHGHHDHHVHHDHYDDDHHHHRHEEVFVVQPQIHYVPQPVVVGQNVNSQPPFVVQPAVIGQGAQPMGVGQGAVSYQAKPVYPAVT